MLFLDTEFTGLKAMPRLLSIALVGSSQDGLAAAEFYAEVTDADRLQAACPFVQETVLPQFGKIAGAACSHEALGLRLSFFLAQFAASATGAGGIVIAFASDFDWMLLQQCLPAHGGVAPCPTLQALNVYNMPGFAVGEAAAQRYFATERAANAPIGRHHALCDARALRIYYAAALNANALAQRQARSIDMLVHG